MKSQWFLELIKFWKIEGSLYLRSGGKIHSNPSSFQARKETFSSRELLIHQLRRNIKHLTKYFHKIQVILKLRHRLLFCLFVFHKILGLLDKFLHGNKQIYFFCFEKKSTICWSKGPPFQKNAFYVWQSCFLSLWGIL